MFQGLKDPVHFVGIAGYGMSGLAELCIKNGLKVSGSDLRRNDITTHLEKLGAVIFQGHAAENVRDAATVVYTSAVDNENPEIKVSEAGKKSLFHRSDLLALAMKGKKAITVAGTHGKTTTTAMIGFMLEKYGLGPVIICGGTMNAYGSTVFSGKSDFVVAEADESDGSFLKYQPFLSVTTNIDFDHMEYFKNKEGLAKAFLSYSRATHKDGMAIVGWDSALTREVMSEFTGPKLAYGFLIGSEVRAIGFNCTDGVSSFKAIVERDQIDCRINMIGKHNVQNALCCLAVGRALGLDLKKVASILSDFPGVKRRQEVIFQSKNVTIFDDYAHNPGKISALVNSIKESWKAKKLLVAFQPHRYSRLDTMYDEMIGSVVAADQVFVLPVYAAGESTEKDYSSSRLAADIAARSGKPAVACSDIQDATSKILNSITPGSLVLTVGAGDVTTVASALRKHLA